MVSGEEYEVHGVKVRAVGELNSGDYDGLVVVTTEGGPLPQALEDFILEAQELDHGLNKNMGVVRCPRVSGARLVLSPTGPLTAYDDVRSVSEAMREGVRRAAAAGCTRPAVALLPMPRWPQAELVALLAALEALYVPLQTRESFPAHAHRVTALGVYGEGTRRDLAALLADAVALELGRGVARDIGGADPERMTPGAAARYVREALAGAPHVSVRVVDEPAELRRRYPLLAAVDRAAATVPRHRGCVVFVEYGPPEHRDTLLLVGKGVTYDTGGCDIKAGGVMAGMSRDKCGAAAVAGFIKTCAELRAPVKVVGALALVRNSVGEEAYVADELVRSARGLAVRVGNTDAEGRMAMADLLAEMAERAPAEHRPHLYTVATLTGHAHRAVGDGYTIAMDNHCARAAGHAARLQAAGELLGEPVEVSVLRREDLRVHRGQAPGDDLHQALSQPSTAVPRGHQGPAGFLLLTAGLHEGAVPYTHLDVAASAGSLPAPPTAAPLLALALAHKVLPL